MKKALSLLLLALFSLLSLTAQRLCQRQVAPVQQGLWRAYKAQVRAAAQGDLTLLPPLSSPLSEAQSRAVCWTLPDSLEADAQLPIAFGHKGAMPREGYPFFLYIHGSGAPADEWQAGLTLTQRWADSPSLYAIPRIPNTGDRYRWYQQAKQWAWERLLRVLFVSDSVDANRLYVTGISEGGYGAQRLAAFYADYWAGAGPMAGGEILTRAPLENLATLAFSLQTGRQDYMYCRDTLTRLAALALDSLRAASPEGYVHQVVLQPGRGHGIDYSPTTPWLAQHRRQPRPRWWRYEAYPMGARYREAFYNLRIDAWPRPAAPSPLAPGATDHYDEIAPRRFHEMRISGNRIDLRIDSVSYEVRTRDPRWHIPLTHCRHTQPATSGRYTLFLSPDMVKADAPVELWVNGRRLFVGRLECRVEHIRAALATWGDPERLFPMALSFDLAAAARL